MLLAVALAAALVSLRANTAEFDSRIVGFMLAKDTKWTESTRSGHRTVAAECMQKK